MENQSILDLDFVTFDAIRLILENHQTRQSFLEVLPPDCSNEHVLLTMEVEGRGYNMTPAKYLLQFLGSKGKTVSDLIEWFEAIQLHKALIHLKKHEQLSILEQPPEEVRIQEGQSFLLTCRASSYPLPEYQWYKDDQELILQVDSDLPIKYASLESSGVYQCLVTRWNADNKSSDYLVSNASCVEVISSDVHASTSFSSQFENKNACFVADFEDQVSSSKEAITLSRHPYVNGKIAQGMSICLDVEVVSAHPVNFQWYKNREPLLGENSDKLILSNLIPDPVNGETKWEYQCIVYNKHYQVLSKVAVVELEEVNDTTPYTATEKIAFLVANDIYENLEDLMKPAADVADLSKLLSSLGFKVMAFRNLTLTEMRNTFTFFCKMLKPGSYALFSFSGHGFELYGQTYLQPVDCSESALHQESICSEYVLQCMQETMPAVNILLIDACRNLPLIMKEGSLSYSAISPGKIFLAKMKNNTIYGYSTTFLSSAHESDSESNSLFVKHLKKYLLFNKSIPEVFRLAQEDFAKDPLIKSPGSYDPIQAPVIKSTLAQPRKLSDSIAESQGFHPQSSVLEWCDIKREMIFRSFTMSKLKAKVMVEFHHHKEAFCNGFDVHLYLYVEDNTAWFILKEVEISLNFSLPFSNMKSTCIALKDISLSTEPKKLLLKKEVLKLQKLKNQHLEGEVLISYCSKVVQNKTFSIDLVISELQLTVNHLQSHNIELSNLSSVTPNFFN